jgi:uncharacterized protein YecE (DUF72 family)
MNWYVGTMGFSYKEWHGTFYPEQVKAEERLSIYSQVFNGVEVDTTFYGVPKVETVTRWAAATPPEFVFCPKTPREISHELRPGEKAVAPMHAFLDVVRHLGDKLGPVLIQLPPDYAFTEIHHLAVFLRRLPADVRFAVEFRHRSWHATATGELLQERGACWASADYLYMPRRLYVTAPFVYVRWLGQRGRFGRTGFEQVDQTERLQAWWERIESRRQEFHTVYGFFNDDFAGHAPASANRFKAIVGLPTVSPQPPQQGSLPL